MNEGTIYERRNLRICALATFSPTLAATFIPNRSPKRLIRFETVVPVLICPISKFGRTNKRVDDFWGTFGCADNFTSCRLASFVKLFESYLWSVFGVISTA